MKKQIIAISLLPILLSPFVVLADIYMGPYCYEDPKQYAVPSKDSKEYKEAGEYTRKFWDKFRAENKDSHGIDLKYGKLRGTCKAVRQDNVITIDNSISDDYLLATHTSLAINCFRHSCLSTTYSERINFATSSTIAASNWRHAVLLDKKFTLSFIESYYADYKELPEFIIMNKEEVKNFLDDDQTDVYLCNKIDNRDTALLSDNGIKRICTYKDKDFATHIIRIPDTSTQNYNNFLPKKLKYANTDDAKLLPKIDMMDKSGNLVDNSSYISITSPITSFTNYWKFTKENNQIALKWIKTEYILDDGTMKTATPDDKSFVNKLVGDKKMTGSVPSTNGDMVDNIDIATPTKTANEVNTNISKTTPQESSGIFDFIWNWITTLFK